MKRLTIVFAIILALFTAMAFVGCDSSDSSSESKHEGDYTVDECKQFAESDFKDHWRKTADYYSYFYGGTAGSEIKIDSCEYLNSNSSYLKRLDSSTRSTPNIYVFRVTGGALCNHDAYMFGSYIIYDYKTGKKISIENDCDANISKGEVLDEYELYGY